MNNMTPSRSLYSKNFNAIKTFFESWLGDSPSESKNRYRRIIMAGLLVYLPLSWWYSIPLTGDQKIYLNIIQEMFERKEWLTPYLFEQTSFQKPPFLYWCILISWKVFGINPFSTVLPNVLFLIGLALCTDRIARSIFKDSPFTFGGFWIYPTIGALTFGTSPQMEISQAFFYALSWTLGMKYLDKPYNQRDIRLIYWAFAVAGLSALIKSPLYSVFWVLGYLVYLLVSGEWDLFRSKHLYLAWIVGIFVGASWFVWALCVHGFSFWDQYFSYETYLKSYTKHGTGLRMWFSYFYHGLPFSLLVIPFGFSLRNGRRSAGLLQFLFSFSVFPAVFFTIYPYKVNTYLFILLPAVALACDWALIREGKGLLFKTTLQVIGFALALCLIAGAILVPAYDLMESQGIHTLWILVFLTLAALFVVASLKNAVRGFLWCSFAFFLIVRILLCELGEIDLKILKTEAASAQEVYLLDDTRNVWNERGLFSTALQRNVKRVETLEQIENLLREASQAETLSRSDVLRDPIFILTEKQSEQYLTAFVQQWTEKYSANKNARLQIVPWKRLKNLKKLRRESIRDQLNKNYTLIRLERTNSVN